MNIKLDPDLDEFHDQDRKMAQGVLALKGSPGCENSGCLKTTVASFRAVAQLRLGIRHGSAVLLDRV